MLTLVVAVVGVSLVYIGARIMLDFARLEASLVALGASVASVAEAIRNPQVDNNSQAVIDDIAGRLEAVSEGLTGLAAEETALDTADAIAEQPPASEPIEPTPEGEGGEGEEQPPVA